MFFYLKILLHFICTTIYVVIIFIVGLLLSLFLSNKKIYTIMISWAKFYIWLLDKLVGINFKIIGKENIINTKCVIIANHQSIWETVAFQVIFSRQTWVLKKKLLYIPFFGWGLSLFKPIAIDRKNKFQALKKVISDGIKRLKQDISIVIFPEGTRIINNSINKYQSSGILLAKKAQVKIQPVVHNSGSFWHKLLRKKKAGTITVIVGKSIDTNDGTVEQITQNIQNWSEENYKKISL